MRAGSGVVDGSCSRKPVHTADWGVAGEVEGDIGAFSVELRIFQALEGRGKEYLLTKKMR